MAITTNDSFEILNLTRNVYNYLKIDDQSE